MDRKSFELLYHDAIKATAQNHLLDALNCIQGMIFNIENGADLNDELKSIRKDYEMMLAFMQQGGTDPQRSAIYQKLIHRTFALTDKATRLYRIQHEKDLYSTLYRRSNESGMASFDYLLESTDMLREKVSEEQHGHSYNPNIKEEAVALSTSYDRLFEFIWTSPLFHPSDAEKLKNFIERQDTNEQALLVSALMLGIQSYFDPQKYHILLHFCHAEENKVRVRALTAVTWTYMQYESRLVHYPNLSEGLLLLTQEERIKHELILLQRQFLLSLDTAKAEKKLQNEIFPDLLKNRNYQRNKMGFDQMEEDLTKALRGEPNSEWEQLKGNKQLADNMKKIIAMGQEGIDINLGTFSGLKTFAFFQQISHWFMPFNEGRPEVQDVLPQKNGGNSPIQLLMNAGNFCDSDKYSLCMMLSQLPLSQREMMITQIGSQVDGFEEQIKDAGKENTSIDWLYRSYLQDLYRFYKLHPHKSQFEDPFRKDLLLTNYNILEKGLKTIPYLMEMASYLIKRECYQDAISYIEEVLQEETANAEMLQKIAFCHQHTDNPSKAIYYYQQADLLNPDNEWILKQMVLCFAALGQYDRELKCLQSLEAMNPGDTRLISETGLCLMQIGRYEEAANRFYELEYKGKRVLPSQRAIAWCNFKMNKLEQADKYYRKIMQQEKAKWEDYLNAGHTAWCLGQMTEAVSFYRNYIRLYGGQRKDETKSLLFPFDEDREELLLHGKEPLDLNLMRDILLPDSCS